MTLESSGQPAHSEAGGTDLALAPRMVDLALDAIATSKTNPRKHFDAATLKELAESMATHGLAQPILIRPVENAEGHGFELVAGERRLRAARSLAWPTIPCIVRALTDLEALELQVIENLQRQDLHPLEEAEGYEQLMKKHGHTSDVLSAKVGKSRAYIYARLKLTALHAKARKAFYDGQLDASRALLIARIPNQKLQDEATKEIVGHQLGFRAASDYVHRRFMLRLADATFKTDDPLLFPEAGPCTTCPKRTGNQPELFGDVKGADVCTDPSCFETKKQKNVAAGIKAAKESGIKVLQGEAAKKVFPYRYSSAQAGFVEADRVGADDPKDRSFEKLASIVKVDPVLVVNPHTGDVVKVFDQKVLHNKLKAAGEISPKKGVNGASAAGRSEEAERLKRSRTQTEIRMRTLRAIGAAAGGAFTWPDTQMLAHWCVDQLDHDTFGRLVKLRGWDPSWSKHQNTAAVTLFIDAMTPDELGQLMFDCALIGKVYVAPWHGHSKPGELEAAAERFGVDAAAIARALKAETEAKKKPLKRPAGMKYWNKETGEAWNGRGQAPKWIEGRDRAPFEVAAP